jgi:hypothetical protein
VLATSEAGEVPFLNTLINRLGADIYGDEFAGAIGGPSGQRAFDLVQHAIDSKAGDLPGGYPQAYSGDYFNAAGAPGDYVCLRMKTTKGTPRFERASIRWSTTSHDSAVVKSARVRTGRHRRRRHRLRHAARRLSDCRDAQGASAIVVVAWTASSALTLDLAGADRVMVPTGKRASARPRPARRGARSLRASMRARARGRRSSCRCS